MSKKKIKYSVFIGRFQPFHIGHKAVVDKALEKTDYLIMALGSYGKAVNTRDPLTFEERCELIKASLTPQELERIKFVKVPDFLYSLDKWLAAVQRVVLNAHLEQFNGEPYTFYLTGMRKDESSFYLNLFPSWKNIDVVPFYKNGNIIGSTEIRYKTFTDDIGYLREYFVNNEAFIKYKEIMNKKIEKLAADFKYEENYSAYYGKGPHLTADSIIVQAGNVLLIERGGDYGAGYWALPGGFLDVNKKETLFEASLRELIEETCIKLPTEIIKRALVSDKIYDDPYRSNRGRIITNAFYYRLKDVGALPKVKGADDAKKAKWVPLSKVKKMRHLMFEDHYDILEDMKLL